MARDRHGRGTQQVPCWSQNPSWPGLEGDKSRLVSQCCSCSPRQSPAPRCAIHKAMMMEYVFCKTVLLSHCHNIPMVSTTFYLATSIQVRLIRLEKGWYPFVTKLVTIHLDDCTGQLTHEHQENSQIFQQSKRRSVNAFIIRLFNWKFSMFGTKNSFD